MKQLNQSNRIEIFIVNYRSNNEINKNLNLIYNQNKSQKQITVNIIDNSSDFALQNVSDKLNIKIFKQSNGIPENVYGKGSIDHASSLNLHINKYDFHKGFTIIMDPDCYIYGEDWIDKLSVFCNQAGTCVATPWHPKHEAKLVKSIAPHFVMFKHMSTCFYDFSPDFTGVSKIRRSINLPPRGVKVTKLREFISNIKRILFWGTSKDTGYKLTKQFEEIVFFTPIIYRGDVFWLRENGEIVAFYSFLLKLFRGIKLFKYNYKYCSDIGDSNEEFELNGCKIVHKRRTSIKNKKLF